MTEESTPVQTSNAEIQSEEKKMETYLVAYLDFLGASERMKKDNGELLNEIADLYSDTKEMLARSDTVFSNLKIKTFSDNIIVAQKVDTTLPFNSFYEENLFGILSFVAYLQILSPVSPGLLIRGGLTLGEFYFDEQFVWGPALLRAHDLESKVAVYPRIVIDSPVLEHISKTGDLQLQIHNEESDNSDIFVDGLHISLTTNEAFGLYTKELSSLVLKDFDGIHYLNSLQILFTFNERYEFGVKRIGQDKVDALNPNSSYLVERIPKLLSIERRFLLKLTNDKITARVFPKLSWVLTYFNSVCTKNGYGAYVINESEYPSLPAYCRYKNGGEK